MKIQVSLTSGFAVIGSDIVGNGHSFLSDRDVPKCLTFLEDEINHLALFENVTSGPITGKPEESDT